MSETQTPAQSPAQTSSDQQKRSLHITLDSLSLYAVPRVRKDRKQLRLTFGCSNGYPNVNAETDEDTEGSKQNGWNRVSSRLNGPNFEGFLGLIEMALTQEAGWRRKIECFHTFKDGVQHETSQHVNDLIVGVDNQGLVYVSIIQEGRTTNKFVFGPTEWHNYRDADGNPLSQKEINHIIAKGTVNSLRVAMATLTALDSFDKQVTKAGLPTPSIKPDGQNGFNNNRNFNNNGGGGFKKPYNGNGGNFNQNNNGGGFKKPYNNNGSYNNNGGNSYKKPYNGNGGGFNNNGGGSRNNFNNGGNRQGGFTDYKNQQNGGQQQPQQPAKVESSDAYDDITF